MKWKRTIAREWLLLIACLLLGFGIAMGVRVSLADSQREWERELSALGRLYEKAQAEWQEFVVRKGIAAADMERLVRIVGVSGEGVDLKKSMDEAEGQYTELLKSPPTKEYWLLTRIGLSDPVTFHQQRALIPAQAFTYGAGLYSLSLVIRLTFWSIRVIRGTGSSD